MPTEPIPSEVLDEPDRQTDPDGWQGWRWAISRRGITIARLARSSPMLCTGDASQRTLSAR